MSAELIRAMSEQLAEDPTSLVFLPLGEALLARGDLASAMRVVRRGAERNPERVDALDLLARIYLAQQDEGAAEGAWRAALDVAPDYSAAHRGLGFLCFRQERWEDAEAHLGFARATTPTDPAVEAAWETLQATWEEAESASAPAEVLAADDALPAPAAWAATEAVPLTADALFAEPLAESAQVALLLDAEGLVVAGTYVTEQGDDLGALIGAQLSGVSDEATRAMRHFGLGQWTRILLESEAATVMMAPTGGGVTLVAAAREVPLGFVRRTLDRCSAVARSWLGEGP